MGKVLELKALAEKLELKAGRRRWMYKGDVYPLKLVSDIEARGGFKGKGSQVTLFLIDPSGKKVAKGMQGALSVKKVTDFIDKWVKKDFKANQDAEVDESIEVDMEIEEKVNADRMIKQMIKAIKDEDEKKLLQFMKKDKKGFFNKRSLDYMVDDGEINQDQARKLGKLSIGVAHALRAMGGESPDVKADQKKRAMDRVKEVE